MNRQANKDFYTMIDIANDLGMTKQAVHEHLKAGNLPPADMIITQSMVWHAKTAKAFIRAHKAGKWPMGRRPKKA